MASYLLNADDETMARWKREAKERGLSFAEFVRAAVEKTISGAVEPDVPVVPRPPVRRGRPVAGGKVFKGMDPKGGKAKK